EALEPGERVLDCGCGPGFLAELLARNGIEVVGTDVSAVGPAMTRGRGFDAVVANSNLEHLFFLRRHVRECARCIRPGGKFIWLVPNIGHWRYRLWLL